MSGRLHQRAVCTPGPKGPVRSHRTRACLLPKRRVAGLPREQWKPTRQAPSAEAGALRAVARRTHIGWAPLMGIFTLSPELPLGEKGHGVEGRRRLVGSKGSLRLALTSPLPGTWVQADTPNSGQTPAARLGRPVPCRAQACITPEACPSGRTAASAEPTLVTLSHSLRLRQSTARRRRVLRAASSPYPPPQVVSG